MSNTTTNQDNTNGSGEANSAPVKNKLFGKPWVRSMISFLVIFTILAVFLYWENTRNKVFIENSYLDAPIISIAPTSPGILNAIYVKEGAVLGENSQIAVVGSEVLYAKDAGIVASAPKALGSYYAPGMPVVTVVANGRMRVVGSIEETKGLADIKKGERALFSVDAFPGKSYEGVVDEVSPVSNDNGIVFSISDKRPIKKFNVYVAFNVGSYPELKSGMSAKVTVITK